MPRDNGFFGRILSAKIELYQPAKKSTLRSAPPRHAGGSLFRPVGNTCWPSISTSRLGPPSRGRTTAGPRHWRTRRSRRGTPIFVSRWVSTPNGRTCRTMSPIHRVSRYAGGIFAPCCRRGAFRPSTVGRREGGATCQTRLSQQRLIAMDRYRGVDGLMMYQRCPGRQPLVAGAGRTLYGLAGYSGLA